MNDFVDPSVKIARAAFFWLRVLIAIPLVGVVLLCLFVLLLDLAFSSGHGRPLHDSAITFAWLVASGIALWWVVPRRRL